MSSPSSDLLSRYLSGQCTDEEKRHVEAWYDAFDQPPIPSEECAEAASVAYQQAQFARVKARIQCEQSGAVPLRPTRRLWQVALAACAVVSLVIGGVWYTRSRATPGRMAARQAPAEVSFTNHQPRVVRYALPDGSTVWLHPDARIAHPSRFQGLTRRVTFSGEGFFSVQRDARRPFIVRSAQMTTRVLGTSFNVRALPGAPDYEVAVVTGKVAVTVRSVDQRAAQEAVLTPRQRAKVTLRTARVVTGSNPPGARRATYEPVSVRFDWTPLDEVARRLESVYNVRIRLKTPALRHCRLRADFTDQSLPAILDLIGKATNTTYALDGEQITLEGAGCPQPG